MNPLERSKEEAKVYRTFLKGGAWEKQFRAVIYEYFTREGRVLPWRTAVTPYKVLVSELMLQQTQVDRVKPKYKLFMKTFPNFKRLAESDLSDVLRLWSGLGYPRRARYLHEIAKEVRCNWKGRLPQEVHELRSLPGIGSYTASAISVFAFNQPEVVIETNIRSVFARFFFDDVSAIDEQAFAALVEACIDRDDPRTWYWALMDYGAALKRNGYRVNYKFKGYRTQAPYRGSDRELRGFVMRCLQDTTHGISKSRLRNVVKKAFNRVDDKKADLLLAHLEKDGLLTISRGKVFLG